MDEIVPPESHKVKKEPVKYIELSKEDDGLRLIRFMQKHYPQLPRGLCEKGFRKGWIRLDGKRVKADSILSCGQWIKIPMFFEEVAPRDSYKPSKEDKALLWQWEICRTEKYIYFDKPAGLAVQGGSGLHRNLDAILKAAGGEQHLRLIHRLDRDTSGILAVARNLQAAREGASKFASDDQVQKFYKALVWGKLKEKGKVEHPIDGKVALTYYTCDQYSAACNMSLVSLMPKTGRKHQLRLHMLKEAGGIVGDKRYGTTYHRKDSTLGTSRLALHHCRLELEAGKVVTSDSFSHFQSILLQMGLQWDIS